MTTSRDDVETRERETLEDIMDTLREHGVDWWEPASFMVADDSVVFMDYTGQGYRLSVKEMESLT